MIDLRVRCGAGLPGEGSGALAAGLGQLVVLRSNGPGEPVCDLTRRGGVGQQAGLSAHFGHAGPGAGDHRGSVGHGLQDRQTEALPDGGEAEGAGAAVGGRQLVVVEPAGDVDPITQSGQQLALGGVVAPTGRTDEDQIEATGVVVLLDEQCEGPQQSQQVLAGLARTRPQDVVAREAPGSPEVSDLFVGDGTGAHSVRDDVEAGGVDARRDAVVSGGLGRDDDGVGLGDDSLQAAAEVGVAARGEVLG